MPAGDASANEKCCQLLRLQKNESPAETLIRGSGLKTRRTLHHTYCDTLQKDCGRQF